MARLSSHAQGRSTPFWLRSRVSDRNGSPESCKCDPQKFVQSWDAHWNEILFRIPVETLAVHMYIQTHLRVLSWVQSFTKQSNTNWSRDEIFWQIFEDHYMMFCMFVTRVSCVCVKQVATLFLTTCRLEWLPKYRRRNLYCYLGAVEYVPRVPCSLSRAGCGLDAWNLVR